MTQELLGRVHRELIDVLNSINQDKIHHDGDDFHELLNDVEKALAQPEQEPMAWLLTDKNINSLQVDSIQRLIDRLKHSHHTDLCVRINGQDEWFEADWLKHLTRTTPPQRTWVGLTFAEICECESEYANVFARNLEAKLKEKNT